MQRAVQGKVRAMAGSSGTTSSDDDAPPVILVIGNLDRWRAGNRVLPDLDGFHFTCLAGVTAELIDTVRPDVVLSALFDPQEDAMEIALHLASLGFAGRYRALATDLPRPEVISRDVRTAVPGLDFDVLTLAQLLG